MCDLEAHEKVSSQGHKHAVLWETEGDDRVHTGCVKGPRPAPPSEVVGSFPCSSLIPEIEILTRSSKYTHRKASYFFHQKAAFQPRGVESVLILTEHSKGSPESSLLPFSFCAFPVRGRATNSPPLSSPWGPAPASLSPGPGAAAATSVGRVVFPQGRLVRLEEARAEELVSSRKLSLF